MPKFVIERGIAGVGGLGDEDFKGISQKSCSVLRELGPEIQWVESFVTGDKIYCIYEAPSEDIIREHAKRGGFPADSVSKVERMISPATADA
ncbi:MAG: DUF4242 domain-containing protein [Caulobacteraceae bacterium]